MPTEIFESDGVHSTVQFSVRHLVVAKVRGRFAKWSATLELDEAQPGRSSVEASIDAASIDTGVPDRDAHLRSPDFLDVERFPRLTFRSKRVESADGRTFRITGDLTLRGVTREVVLEAEYAGRIKDPSGAERLGWSARTAIDRKDYGLTWNQILEAGGIAVGDRVSIEIELEAVKRAAVKAA